MKKKVRDQSLKEVHALILDQVLLMGASGSGKTSMRSVILYVLSDSKKGLSISWI